MVRHANSEYAEQPGYVVQVPGGDIADLPAEVLDLEGAQAKCDNNAECNAISFSGSSGTPKVYYKRDASHIYNDCWKSYSKNGNWEEHDGFLPHSSDQEVVGLLDEAKQACQGDAKCKGFSVREGTQVHHLKKTWSPPHPDCWQTYVKMDEQDADVQVGDPVYYAGADVCADGSCAADTEEVEAPVYYAGAEPTTPEEAAAPAYYAAAEEAAAPPAYYAR